MPAPRAAGTLLGAARHDGRGGGVTAAASRAGPTAGGEPPEAEAEAERSTDAGSASEQ